METNAAICIDSYSFGGSNVTLSIDVRNSNGRPISGNVYIYSQGFIIKCVVESIGQYNFNMAICKGAGFESGFAVLGYIFANGANEIYPKCTAISERRKNVFYLVLEMTLRYGHTGTDSCRILILDTSKCPMRLMDALGKQG